MTDIGKPTSDKPLQVPAPWTWPEPKKETTPEQRPAQEPVKVPSQV